MASRPTKYAHVVGSLPKFQSVEPERRDLVDRVKAEIREAPDDDYNVCAQARSSMREADTAVEDAFILLKRAVAGKLHASAFANAYAEVRHAMDIIASWKSSAQLLLDAYESLMIEQMEAEKLASLRLDSGASVSTYSEPFGQVRDKEAFRQWCVANGYENQLQLWPSSMNAIAKERTLAGEAPPDGVEVFAKTMVRLNKA
jgi:hypothetical protein